MSTMNLCFTLTVTQIGGRLIAHDEDVDVLYLQNFNGIPIFENFTQRLLDFNVKYPPFTLMAGMHVRLRLLFTSTRNPNPNLSSNPNPNP